MSSASNGEDLSLELQVLESQLEQLVALLPGVDSDSPLLSLKNELTATIQDVRVRLEQSSRDFAFKVGDVCLAPRFFDRRLAKAVVESMNESIGTATVSWLHPRQRREIPCRFWRQAEGCNRAGPDCSFSHGVEFPTSVLQHILESRTEDTSGEEQSLPVGIEAGSKILAKFRDQVWYEATVVDRAEDDQFLLVEFKGYEDTPERIPAKASHMAPFEDNEAVTGGDEDGHGESDLEDAWADVPIPGVRGREVAGNKDTGNSSSEISQGSVRVIGFLDRSQGGRRAGGDAEGGLFGDAYMVGEWEQHTKGFGSRMLSRMGYRRGEGLGKDKQGIAKPVPIRVLPPGRALDHIYDPADPGERGAPVLHNSTNLRKSKKHKLGARGIASEVDAEPQKAMFDFLNVTIHAVGNKAAGVPTGRGDGKKTGAGAGVGLANGSRVAGSISRKRAVDMSQSELRSHLVKFRETESMLAAKVASLEETIARNRDKDPRTAQEARRRLEEVREKMQEVRLSCGHVERTLTGKDGDSRGGKGRKRMFSF